jgi:spore germination cell wall hydrolase CwlJ-like protein
MARSRLAWIGSTVAPWGMALGFLVSITAQAGQEPGWAGAAVGLVARSAPADPLSPTRVALLASSLASTVMENADEAPSEASLALGAPEELAAVPDEIEPNAALKRAGADFPAVDRTGKSDPFVVLRPGFESRLKPPSLSFEDAALDARDEGLSPAAPGAASGEAAAPAPAQFGDGATPNVPLEVALNSSTPTPSDGKPIIAAQRTPAQTTLAQPTAANGRPNYAALIDPKDSTRQMRCLAEAIYFEARGEPEAGQAAVAQVVLNRVRSGIFPTNVCAVVYQDRNRPYACQFSFACDGTSLRIEEPAAWTTAARIAQDVVSGVAYNPKVAEALNYHAYYVYPFWAGELRRVDRIGGHIFYAMRVGLNWAPGAFNGRGDIPPASPLNAAAPATVASTK